MYGSKGYIKNNEPKIWKNNKENKFLTKKHKILKHFAMFLPSKGNHSILLRKKFNG